MAVAATVMLGGCDVLSAGRRCELGPEHAVADLVGYGVDDVALVEDAAGAVAFWSEASGLRARRLGSDGRPAGELRRLGPRCRGGIAVDHQGPLTHVACLFIERGDKHPPRGGASLYRVDEKLDVQHWAALGDAGLLSDGIDVLAHDDTTTVAWHDADALHERLWRADVAEGSVDRRAIPTADVLLSGPSLGMWKGAVRITWAETFTDDEDETHGRLVIGDGRGAPREIARLHAHDAMPRLLMLGPAGRPWVLFRDVRGRRRRGLYAQGLDAALRPEGDPVRFARADGRAAASACACQTGVAAAAPRTYGDDRFVGLSWMSRRFEQPSGERQFFENSVSYSHASVACLAGRAVALIAEQARSTRPRARLWAVPFSCD